MTDSYEKLLRKYIQLKREERAAIDRCFAARKNGTYVRDLTAICAGNMVMLYLLAHLCRYDEKRFAYPFMLRLYAVEACAFQVLKRRDAVYIFLAIALCDAWPSVRHLVRRYMPDFTLGQPTAKTAAFVRYVRSILTRLHQSGAAWYGDRLTRRMSRALRAGEYFIVPDSEDYIRYLTRLC